MLSKYAYFPISLESLLFFLQLSVRECVRRKPEICVVIVAYTLCRAKDGLKSPYFILYLLMLHSFLFTHLHTVLIAFGGAVWHDSTRGNSR